MGIRRAYTAIMGLVLIMYGLVLNLLGAIASFIHPGEYHHGAMGTPMWCGLAFILFGAIHLQHSFEWKLKKSGLQILMPVINILIIITSALCIALTSWAMGAPGVAIITSRKVTEFTISLPVEPTESPANTNGNESDSQADRGGRAYLQMSLVPIYATIITASSFILLMAIVGICIEFMRYVALDRPVLRHVRRKFSGGWEERNGRVPQYPVDDKDAGNELHWDAMGEIMYVNTPAAVQTMERPNFQRHIEPSTAPQGKQTAYANGRIPQASRKARPLQRSPHNPGPGIPDTRTYSYPSNKQREFERLERRPNPYFYL